MAADVRPGRLRRRSAIGWWIEDSCLCVTGMRGFWIVESDPRVTEQANRTRAWLGKYGLHRAQFRTRSEAVRTCLAFMRDDPPPSRQCPRAALTRAGQGRYRAAGGFTVIRHPEQPAWWQVLAPDGTPLAVRTLTEAAEAVAALRLVHALITSAHER